MLEALSCCSSTASISPVAPPGKSRAQLLLQREMQQALGCLQQAVLPTWLSCKLVLFLCSAWHFRFRQQLRVQAPSPPSSLCLPSFLPALRLLVLVLCAAFSLCLQSLQRRGRPCGACDLKLQSWLTFGNSETGKRGRAAGEGGLQWQLQFAVQIFWALRALVCFLSCLASAETYAHI